MQNVVGQTEKPKKYILKMWCARKKDFEWASKTHFVTQNAISDWNLLLIRAGFCVNSTPFNI